MKINKLTIEKFDIELKNSFEYFNVSLKYLPYALVNLETDQGFFAYGEVSLAWDITGETQEGAIEIINLVKHLVEGREIKEVSTITSIMQKINSYLYGNTALKCGIEMALFDALGKYQKTPVYKLIGGKKDVEVIPQKVLDYNEQDFSKIFDIIDEGIVSGVKIFKLKSGDGKIVEKLKQIYTKYPDINLVLDVNQGWVNAQNAINLIKQIEGYNILWIEQPIYCKDFKGLSEIRKKISLPIMADESCHDLLDLENLHQRNCVDLINIKLAKCGGILEAIKMVNYCEKHNIKYMLGDMIHSEIGTAYNLHASTIGNFVTFDLTSPARLKNKLAEGIEYNKAQAFIPKGYGLGINLKK